MPVSSFMMQKYGKLLINLNNPVILTFDNGLAPEKASPQPLPRREGHKITLVIVILKPPLWGEVW